MLSQVLRPTKHGASLAPRVTCVAVQLVAQRTVDVEVGEEDMRKAFDKVSTNFWQCELLRRRFSLLS